MWGAMEESLKKFTLPHLFSVAIDSYADNPFTAFVGQVPMTYQEFGREVNRMSYLLEESGIGEGEKIVILGDNSPNWGVAFFAITTMAAIVVPILSEFPESDINHILNHSEAAAIFIDDKFYHSMDLKALNHMGAIISLDNLQLLQSNKSSSKKTFAEVNNSPKDQNILEDQLAEILYTSGTTGHSKGVMLTHKNIVSNALSGPRAISGLSEQSIILNLLPLAHAYGSTTSFLGAFSQGASLFFLDRKPSPKILMEALQILRPTIVTGVPLIFEKIYHKKVLPEISGRTAIKMLSNLRLGRKLIYRKIGKRILDSFGGRLHSFVIGGASLNNEVELFLRESKIPFAIGYGLSECSPIVSGDFFSSLKFGSVGRPIDGVEVKIENPDPESGVGEICVKGPNVMKGYYKNEIETEKVLSSDGWLKTGDLGFVDGEHFIFIKGRSKNVYVGSSGENIYPEIVEDKLKESTYVEEALVYFEDDQIVARIYLDYDYIQTILHADKHVIQPQEIEQILDRIRLNTNQKLPGYSKIIRIIEQLEPFVKTPTNKIRRVLYVPDYQKSS